MHKSILLFFGLTLSLLLTSQCQAGGRTITGGHPYHNGYYAIPPASAYEAVWFRPPIRYGAPAYYYPESYLPPDFPYYAPALVHPSVPYYRAGGYYLSNYGYYYVQY